MASEDELFGTWIEDPPEPDLDDDDDDVDDSMQLHALVLGRDAAGRGLARYGQIYASNHGTDEQYGEGTFRCVQGGLVVDLPALGDWSDAAGLGYESRRSQVRARRFEFMRSVVDGEAIVLTSHLDPGFPRVPPARFVRVTDPSAELAQLDALAERARVRQGGLADRGAP
ncbi:hypothetical protein [Nannocystis bainbridge]|uniref:Uncharacterized protein n=1 Tax=Nannocystis bainbridge TaxID=2995303 RepID=A0ABT5E6K2_9BACT|nr:hypothetical protein [Nannocystis bainbridge]MDC0720969.1 hypothetical protein [Nannocystis bainbridge]